LSISDDQHVRPNNLLLRTPKNTQHSCADTASAFFAQTLFSQ